MSTVFDRFGYNFDSSKFGEAATMSQNAANTINLISNSTPQYQQWQIDDLSAGSPVRTNYFKNPTQTYTSGMLSSAGTIRVTANTIMSANTLNVSGGGYTTSNVFVSTDQINTAAGLYGAMNNLIVELNNFHSHTDNISGVTIVTSVDFPSYENASGLGQMNMMTLAKTDGTPANTVPILGSFTSLFILDELSANNTQLAQYSTQLNNTGSTSTFMQSISNYANSTISLMSTRRNGDWNFFRNSMQVMKDIGFLQQFNNLGGTQQYLLNNLIGTDQLKTKLNSQ